MSACFLARIRELLRNLCLFVSLDSFFSLIQTPIAPPPTSTSTLCRRDRLLFFALHLVFFCATLNGFRASLGDFVGEATPPRGPAPSHRLVFSLSLFLSLPMTMKVMMMKTSYRFDPSSGAPPPVRSFFCLSFFLYSLCRFFRFRHQNESVARRTRRARRQVPPPRRLATPTFADPAPFLSLSRHPIRSDRRTNGVASSILIRFDDDDDDDHSDDDDVLLPCCSQRPLLLNGAARARAIFFFKQTNQQKPKPNRARARRSFVRSAGN